MNSSPSMLAYAKQVAYLGCPHKIQRAVAYEFGHAPSLSLCADVVKTRGRVNHTAGRGCDDCDAPIDRANKSGLCGECIHARRAAERALQPAPEPVQPITITASTPIHIPVGPIDKALRACPEVFGIEPNLILSAARHGWIAQARQAVMLVVCEESKLSFPQIGRRLKRDHSTVIHGRDVARDRAARNPDYAEKVEALRRAVRA